MSKIGNPKKVLKKTLEDAVSEHNALIFIFLPILIVTIKKNYFISKQLKVFFYFQNMEIILRFFRKKT
jgi:hypothetical protein